MSDDTQTLTLAEFLLARIADDEVSTREVLAWKGSGTTYPVGHPLDPARVLAECEAKRRIVNLMGYVLESWDANHGGDGRSLWPDVNRRERSHARTVLEQVALPYADHPEFREEWKL